VCWSHPVLPVWIYPDVASAAGTASAALADDTGDPIVYGNIHYMIANRTLVGFLAAIWLDEGDIDVVFLRIHHHIITAVEFPRPAS